MLRRVMMGKVLIVGAGITGAVTASLLKLQLPPDTSITVWDKAMGAGGRMSTSRCPTDSSCTVDLGAQYISSSTQDFAAHKSIYEGLTAEGVLQEFHEKLENDKFTESGATKFITPNGVSSLVKYFLKKSGADTKYSAQVTQLQVDNDKWQVTTDTGSSDTFDGVILTIPVPQILQLQGSISNILDNQPDVKRKMQNVEYSSRFALGLFYDKKNEIDIPWTAKYIEGHSCIRFISIDNKKRNAGDVVPSIVVHASVPFSLEHLEEDKEKVCRDYLLPELGRLLPQLPPAAAIKSHKWSYSQVYRCMEGKPGAVLLHNKPPLICAGDAFTNSTFDGCIQSATSAASLMKQL